MYKVIIVDDEPLIRRGLREKIDWNSLNYEIVAEAANGLEAVKLAKSINPDVVITDMKMPLMDGIGLLEAFSNTGVKAKVIVVSAYSSFNYTHAALRNGAFDYILKPLDADELIEVLLKAKKAIESDKKPQTLTSDIHTAEEPVPVMKENFLNSFVSNGVIDKNNLDRQLVDMGMALDCKTYICLAIMIPELFNLVKNNFQHDYDKAFIYITRLIQNIVSNNGFEVTTFRNPLYIFNFYVILGFKSEPATILEMVENIKSRLEEFLLVDLNIGVGEKCSSFHEIGVSFTQALDVLSYRSIISESCVMFSNDMNGTGSGRVAYSSEKEKAFLTSVEICNWEEIEYNVNQLFEFIRNTSGISFRQVYKLFSELLFLCERVLRKYDGSLELIFNEDISSIDYIACKGSLPKLEQWFLQVITSIMKYIHDKKSSNMSNVVDNIKDYIDNHYFEDIGLNDMSLKFYINKSYLSALFKKRIGQTFVDYVTMVRMKKAAELLGYKRHKVYEVARMVGYTDDKYFSKLFKKHYFLNPEEYIKNALRTSD